MRVNRSRNVADSNASIDWQGYRDSDLEQRVELSHPGLLRRSAG